MSSRIVDIGAAAVAIFILGAAASPRESAAQAPQAGTSQAAPAVAGAAEHADERETRRKAVTNDDITKMVENRFDESTVLDVIDVSDTQFDVSPAALIALKKAGVGDRVIGAMLESTRRARTESARTAGDALKGASSTAPVSATSPGASSAASAMSGMTPQTAAAVQAAMARAQSMGLGMGGARTMAAMSQPSGGEAGALRVFLVADGSHTELSSVFAQRAVSQFKGGGSSGGASMLTSLAGQALHFAALGAGPAGIMAVGGFSMVSRIMPGMRPSGPTMTYAWGLPGAHSERVLAAMPPSFDFTYKDIPGIDPDAYEPVLLKFVLTKDNYRLIGATRQKLNRESMMNGGPSGGDWVAEDRLRVQLQKSNRGECTLHVTQVLEPGEYGVVLRPVKGYNSHPSGFGGAEQLSAMVWDFSIRAATADASAANHK
jgi:hypothetical protein